MIVGSLRVPFTQLSNLLSRRLRQLPASCLDQSEDLLFVPSIGSDKVDNADHQLLAILIDTDNERVIHDIVLREPDSVVVQCHSKVALRQLADKQR